MRRGFRYERHKPFQIKLAMALFVMCVASALIPSGLWMLGVPVEGKTVAITAVFGWSGALLLVGFITDHFTGH